MMISMLMIISLTIDIRVDYDHDCFSSEPNKIVPSNSFIIDGDAHLGRRISIRVKPVNTACDGRLCKDLLCCSGRNPFSGFQVLMNQDHPATLVSQLPEDIHNIP